MNDFKTYLKLNLCMLSYFHKKPEITGMITITMTFNCLVRVLLRNYISHSYISISSSEDVDGQCDDLRWVPYLALVLWLGVKCHHVDDVGSNEGLYLSWPSISFFCYASFLLPSWLVWWHHLGCDTTPFPSSYVPNGSGERL